MKRFKLLIKDTDTVEAIQDAYYFLLLLGFEIILKGVNKWEK